MHCDTGLIALYSTHKLYAYNAMSLSLSSSQRTSFTSLFNDNSILSIVMQLDLVITEITQKYLVNKSYFNLSLFYDNSNFDCKIIFTLIIDSALSLETQFA